jgi:hypothetical protein
VVLLTPTVLMLAALVSGDDDADNSSSFWDNWSDNSYVRRCQYISQYHHHIDEYYEYH